MLKKIRFWSSNPKPSSLSNNIVLHDHTFEHLPFTVTCNKLLSYLIIIYITEYLYNNILLCTNIILCNIYNAQH